MVAGAASAKVAADAGQEISPVEVAAGAPSVEVNVVLDLNCHENAALVGVHARSASFALNEAVAQRKLRCFGRIKVLSCSTPRSQVEKVQKV